MSVINTFARNFPACKRTIDKAKAKGRSISGEELSRALLFNSEFLTHSGHLMIYPTLLALSKRIQELGDQNAAFTNATTDLSDLKLHQNPSSEIFRGYAASLRNTQREIQHLKTQMNILSRQLEKISRTNK
jgi:hypothetical protein